MRLITLYMPEPYLKALDFLVEKRYYPNRAEAIRLFIRDGLKKEGMFGLGDSGEASVILAKVEIAEHLLKFTERRRRV